MAAGMTHYLRRSVVIVVLLFGTTRGKPSPAGIQVATISDRIDGSQNPNEENNASGTSDDDFTDSTTPVTGTTHDRVLFGDTPIMDVITLIWYLATFIALISFFLVMACADRNRCRSRKPATEELTPPPTPAPSYRQFAPPSYDTLEFDKDNDSIYIIPYDARIESEHQQYAESLANNLEQVIVQPNDDGAATGDIMTSTDDAGTVNVTSEVSRNEGSEVSVASEVSSVLPVVRPT